MTSPVAGARAVVVGCGMAGIAAAAALRRAGAAVTVVEADHLPAGSVTRPGVPQGDQLHNLLSRAQRHLEALLPGFGAELERAGGRSAAVADETRVFELGIVMPRRDLGLRLTSSPRPVMEAVARRLLLRDGDVRVRDGVRAAGLELDAAGAVRGLRLESGTTLPATIVVDATGSRSASVRWLRACGRPAPDVDAQPGSRWYATLSAERPAAYAGDNRFWMVFPSADGTRGGLVSPDGDTRWSVSLSGGSADPPPTTATAARAYAARFATPWIGNLLASATQLSTPTVFHKPVARWRRFDQLAAPPPGLLPIGDAVASLNPLFGQGVSVAAWQAAELGDLLSAAGPERSLAALTVEFHARAARACQAAWSLGASLAAPPDVARELAFRAQTDRAFHRRIVAAWHLLEPTPTVASSPEPHPIVPPLPERAGARP